MNDDWDIRESRREIRNVTVAFLTKLEARKAIQVKALPRLVSVSKQRFNGEC